MLRLASAITALFFVTSTALAQSGEFGEWISLFDGKTTKGWTQAKGGQADKPWRVEDGALTNAGNRGMDLCTEETFKDYELEVEYKVPEDHGNSGVYLRGQVEVQIASGNGAGSIYNTSDAKRHTQKPGEWNQFRILHIGNRVTVWHNGALVQDNVWVKDRTGGHMTEFPLGSKKRLELSEGPIMLQGDHSDVWYRNIRIRPLFAGKGWKKLWNGKDLSQFRGRGDEPADKHWMVVLDEEMAKKKGEELHSFTNATWYNGPEEGDRGHDIWTKGEFGNFLVHYAYKSGPAGSGNSGFYLRNQWEIQINKNQRTGEGGKSSDGALYSLKAPDVKARHASDEWNHMDVKVEGMKIWVWQNGKLLHDGVVCRTRTDNHGTETLEFSKGPFKLQGDHDKVWFTDLWIQELPDTP